MNTPEYYRGLFAYELRADMQSLESIESASGDMAPTYGRMGHLIAALALWLDRVCAKEQRMAVWPQMAAAEARAELEGIGREWTAYLEALTPEELQRPVDYRNSAGHAFTSSVEQILTHLMLHGAYHRGQIASDVRAAGGTPAQTDYIFAVRQGNAV